MAVEAIRASSSVQASMRDLRSAIVACARTASSAGHRRTCEVVWRAVHPRFSDDTLQLHLRGMRADVSGILLKPRRAWSIPHP
jgi:hypothetical protein